MLKKAHASLFAITLFSFSSSNFTKETTVQVDSTVERFYSNIIRNDDGNYIEFNFRVADETSSWKNLMKEGKELVEKHCTLLEKDCYNIYREETSRVLQSVSSHSETDDNQSN